MKLEMRALKNIAAAAMTLAVVFGAASLGCSPEKGCGRGVERKSAHKSLLHFEICI